MTRFLGTVLGVIAVGVLLIAYGLLGPRASATPGFATPGVPAVFESNGQLYQATPVNQPGRSFANSPAAPVNYNNGFVSSQPAAAVPVREAAPDEVVYRPAPRAAAPARSYRTVQSSDRRVVVEKARGRNWKKTALVVGGTTATGAGVGALIGGKKGALIGAAIGGGASSIYEARKQPR
jgi:hypothetical protein